VKFCTTECNHVFVRSLILNSSDHQSYTDLKNPSYDGMKLPRAFNEEQQFLIRHNIYRFPHFSDVGVLCESYSQKHHFHKRIYKSQPDIKSLSKFGIDTVCRPTELFVMTKFSMCLSKYSYRYDSR